MSYTYGSQTQQSLHPYQQQMGSIPVRFNNMAALAAHRNTHQNVMNMASQMSMMNRSLLQHNAQAPAGGPIAEAQAPKTLELKVVVRDMTPRSSANHAGHVLPAMNQKWVNLAKQDATLIQLIEVFTFQHRRRMPMEPEVMKNASLYYNRLKDKKSALGNRITDVTGFRCCGCRHTTMGANSGYIVGAAQLIVSSDHFHKTAVLKSLMSLKEHMLQCHFITPPIKQALGESPPIFSPRNTSLENYIESWIQSVVLFSQRFGYPKLQPSLTNNMQNRGPMGTTQGLTAFQQARYHPAPYQQPAVVDDTENVVRWELEDCVNQALVGNNYGVASVKPRTIVPDLSDLPISAPQEVSPILEVLLQSLCAIQRWRTTSAAITPTKRSNEEMKETKKMTDKQRLSNVFFECRYCNNHSLCASTANAKDTAEFILESACKHLCEECPEVPEEVQEKLETMFLQITDAQRSKQTRVIEQNLNSWKALFPENTGGGKKKSTKRVQQSKFWRPLTWKYLEENTGACIADASLADKGPCAYLVDSETKKLPFEPRRDDVIFGWNGKHVGNRRFLELMNDARLALFEQESPSVEQDRVIACELMRAIGRRGGRFFVLSNPLTPAVMVPPEKTVHLILQSIKRGNSVLLQPFNDPNKRGRGSYVLECEVAPQRSLFGKGIVRNKRFKKSAPVEEGSN